MTRSTTMAIFCYSLLAIGTACLLASISQCEVDGEADGFEISDGDCDDQNANVYPGALELCNGYDEDCDGTPDDACCASVDCGCTRFCTDGEPCGDTCIDPDEHCDIGAGTACWLPAVTPTPSL